MLTPDREKELRSITDGLAHLWEHLGRNPLDELWAEIDRLRQDKEHSAMLCKDAFKELDRYKRALRNVVINSEILVDVLKPLVLGGTHDLTQENPSGSVR